MLCGGGIGTDHQVRRKLLLGGPGLLMLGRGQVGGELADAKGGHVPCAAADEVGDAVLVGDVGMLHRVGAQLYGHLDCFGVGGVSHHRKVALAAQGEGRLNLLWQQERFGVPVPPGSHDAARKVELYVVHVVLHLVADSLGVTVRAVAFPGVAGGQKMAASGGQEIPAGKDPRPSRPRPGKRLAPGNVHEIPGPAASHSSHPGLDHASLQVLAEVGSDLSHGGTRGNRVLWMDMHVPQSRCQVGASQVDHPVFGVVGARPVVSYL